MSDDREVPVTRTQQEAYDAEIDLLCEQIAMLTAERDALKTANASLHSHIAGWSEHLRAEKAEAERDEARTALAMTTTILEIDVATLAAERDEARQLLRESIRTHYHCDDSWFCCGKCRNEDHSLAPDEWLPDNPYGRKSGVCNCDVDAWNKRVEEALK